MIVFADKKTLYPIPQLSLRYPLPLFLLLLILLTGSCQQGDAGSGQSDPHSFADPEQAVVTHLDLNLRVDFEQKQLSGAAAWSIKPGNNADHIIFDTHGLTIDSVKIYPGAQPASYRLGSPQGVLGSPLRISITPATRAATIYYRTSPQAEALQWLPPEQTAGGKAPFLFTQSQAILARSWVPCQDSPGIRFTYTADVQTSPELMAVMSASNSTEKHPDGRYRFTMEQPIPSYLLALAVGDLEFRPLGPRSGVYAEPTVIAKAAFEFGDTEKMITATEALYGPYRWERYDILVLPPSFPFGGMENPRLTFATPTILAGDRSLVALVAHELAHSWSGNLATNKTWDDFWLNEGFTTYLEGRIMEAVYGADYALMLAQLGYQDALEEIEDLGENSPDTHLHLSLAGRNPDDGMNDIAYEKGRLFLTMLETYFGRERWDHFLRNYFDAYAFKPVDSEDFLNFLRAELIQGDAAVEKDLQINEWVYGPGLPENSPRPASPEFARVEKEIDSWRNGKPAAELNIRNWTTHHWLHFLRNLPGELSQRQLAELDQQFQLTQSQNSEILCAWLLKAIPNNYAPARPQLEAFLESVGRRKFLAPLYRALAGTEGGLEQARRIYRKARPGYHPVAYHTIDRILGVNAGS